MKITYIYIYNSCEIARAAFHIFYLYVNAFNSLKFGSCVFF